jgi:ubiquinone/menaquinone biosynthesis C-methylase UbiE
LNSFFRSIYLFLRAKLWFVWLLTFVSCIVLTVAVVERASPIWLLTACLALACLFFASGYLKHASREKENWPPLSQWKRHDYANVWDSLASSMNDAAVAAAGESGEVRLSSSAADSVANLKESAAISENDDVLEIGCGVGRIGKEIASRCRSWTGADISANMLAHAAARLESQKNIRLVQLKDVGLDEFAADSFDVVYATNMLAHLDELDRWNYVQEAFRVLRAGGRIFLDNIDLESDAGWSMFANDAIRFRGIERPPYMPRFSTAAEFMSYVTRAGFKNAHAQHRLSLVIVTAVKPRVL